MAAGLESDGPGRFKVQGDLNFATAASLWQESSRLFPPHSTLLVDLAGVTRSDSAGVALLVEWLRQAQARRQTLQFAHIPAQMQAIIQIADLQHLLPVLREEQPV
jgi:phospholipid transport system transporter-binding protein